MNYYAHTTDNKDKSDWQLLLNHITEVAQKSREFAREFGADKLGYIAGFAHDLGKYSNEFQERLEGKRDKVDHSTAGAREVEKKYGMLGRVLAYVIAGHHGGLPNGNKEDENNLRLRLSKEGLPNYQAFEKEITLPDLQQEDIDELPKLGVVGMQEFSIAFFIRMLYSCLVDADYLDTESFMSPTKAENRADETTLGTLLEKLNQTLDKIRANGRKNNIKIYSTRQQILSRCIEMSKCKPDFFTLTVPTGGGKTYSSLAFALNHAVEYQKKRVIYVVPFTSVTEQNAGVFREAVGEEFVLEHHSNYDYPEEAFDEWSPEQKKLRLASENWKMPLIATTAVQFYESLFSNKSSRLRKLHNIANSVIVLDEAQTMPTEYLRPCIWALTELVMNYKVTVVFCTATQPAIKDLIPAGLKPVEITENPEALQQIFKRVKIDYIGFKEDQSIAEAMSKLKQVLCIVNTRSHAEKLFQKLTDITNEGVYHLSARMCPAHRKEILKQIKSDLKDKKTCRVVATQLVEAGVDFDFPVVYRSMAGVDSITQAAGRCNREGELDIGKVCVFEPETHGMPKKGRFERNAAITRNVQRRYGNELLSLEAIQSYFEEMLEFEDLDAKQILKATKEGGGNLEFPFKAISESFHLIDNDMYSVIVPYDDKVDQLKNEIEKSKFPASYTRKLQKYTVQIYKFELEALIKAKVIPNEKTADLFWFLEDTSFYDEKKGLLDAKEVKVPKDVLLL